MARYIQSNGIKYIGDDAAPIRFRRTTSGRYRAEHDGATYELEKRSANLRDGCPDTGWYLYGDGHFGTWCARRILDAVDEASREILGHP